jgi:DNA-binding CsgD family transcriptional regulator
METCSQQARLSLDALIPGIYRSAMEQPPWRSFVDELRQVLRLRHCSISFFTGSGFDDHRTITVVSGDRDLDYIKLGEQYERHYSKLDPLHYRDLADGKVHVQGESEYLAFGERGAEFFHGYMAPHGFHHHAIVKPEVHDGSHGGLLVCARGPGIGAYSEAEIEILRALNPHLGHALRHFAVCKQLELERDLYEQTIDNLGVGSLLIDEGAHVLRRNHCANRMLARLSQIALVDGRLVLTDAEKNAEFKRLIRLLAQAPAGNSIQVLRLAARSCEDLRLMIKPIPPTAEYYNTQRPKVMVYLQDASAQQTAPAQLVADLFGLTRTEAVLAIWLARGHTLQQAAQEMNISEHTARNYSKRIFAKTGTRRQVDLVRVMLQSVALLTAG